MKQHIEEKELEKLSKEQLGKLLELFVEEGSGDTYNADLIFEYLQADNNRYFNQYIDFSINFITKKINIGKMIEILVERVSEFEINKWGEFMVYTNITSEIREKELVDALWEAVKYVLEEDNE